LGCSNTQLLCQRGTQHPTRVAFIAMIDWFSGYVGYDASGLEFGRFFEVDRQGEVVRQLNRWETARGSFESGVQVTRGTATDAMLKVGREQLGYLCNENVLRVSGNPVKFLQGHNAAGPSVAKLGPGARAASAVLGDDGEAVGLVCFHADHLTIAKIPRIQT
jgi:hypothetical protein